MQVRKQADRMICAVSSSFFEGISRMPPVQQHKTPGVYVIEEDAFPPSVIGLESAVPIFIGYTERAELGGKPVKGKPVRISSLAEYQAIFGGLAKTVASIGKGTADESDFAVQDASGTLHSFKLTAAPKHILAAAMRLFFANGGQSAYVVSVGGYSDAITLDALQAGLDAAGNTVGPTLTVLPEATLLPSADFGTLAQAALAQAEELNDRFVLLDVFGAQALDQQSTDYAQKFDACITQHRALVAGDHLAFGASYLPPVNTSMISRDDLDYSWFDPAQLSPVLELAAKAIFDTPAELASVVLQINAMAIPVESAEDIGKLNTTLINALPVFAKMLDSLALKLSVLPPSAGMAGVINTVDYDFGAWKAPANVTMRGVISPTLSINNEVQDYLTAPLDGIAINALRSFPGRGVVVWGARTMAGNSVDWRYVPVRRTVIYIEQSIQTTLQYFVFSNNDSRTWTTVVSMISNFLHGIWAEGGLQGASPKQAYSVDCGLGSTMTAQDILDGNMIVQARISLVHPAEFFDLIFHQKMPIA